MNIKTSNSLILLSEHERIATTMHKFLNEQSLNIASDFINLHKLDLIRTALKRTKNTAFIRTELLRFLREKGSPFAFILDFRIDSGLDTELDPDKMKILRTLLISIIILSQGAGFKDLQGNFLLLGHGKDLELLKGIEKNPDRLLTILNTKNEKVNALIESLKNDLTTFNQTFFIRGADYDSDANEFGLIFNNFTEAIKVRGKKRVPEKKEETLSQNNEPAHIIYVLNSEQVYYDGETIDRSEELKEYKENQFYIRGNWTNKTIKEVTDKLRSALKTGAGRGAPFVPEDTIVINLTEDAIIDASTAVPIAQMLVKELEGYTEVSIPIDRKNFAILSKAKGFGLIQKHIKQI